MIINTKGSDQKSSNNVMKKYAYKLDDSTEAVALIAETLRKSYKYIEQTPVQEYLSNARDIHRELKLKKAIDVQIPTELNPEFFIRDYGSGLSEEQIVDYITFAKSTKRKNNTLTGGFGYGSKSFFAYADSFTIISFYNGMKYIYRASCVQNKEGALVLLRSTETKEPNGLQVQVAVRPQDRKAFLNAVLRLKQHWDDQEINIINLNPTELVYSKQQIDSVIDVKIYKDLEKGQNNYRYNSDNRSVFLLIDGIPYSIDNLRFNNKNVINFINSIQSEYQIVFEFKTGDIAISKYREYIEATPENISFIEAHILNKIDIIKTHLAKELPVISNIDDLKALDYTKLFVISQEISLKSSNKNIAIKVKPYGYYDKSGICVSLNFEKEITFPYTKTYMLNNSDAMTNNTTLFADSYYTRLKSGDLTFNQSNKGSNTIDQIDFNCTKNTMLNIIVNDCEQASLIEQSSRIKNYLKNHTTDKKVVIFSSDKNSKDFTELCTFFKSIKLSTIDKLVVVRQKRDGASTPRESNINKQNYTNTFVELTNQGEFKIRRKSEKVSFNHNSKFQNKTLVVPTQSNAFAKDISEAVLLWAKFCGYEVILANKENCEFLGKKPNAVSYNDFIVNPKYSKKEEENIVKFHQVMLMLDFKQKNSLVYHIGDFVDYLPEAFNKKDLSTIKEARNMINRDKFNESAITGLEEELVEFKNLKVNAYKNKAKEQFKQITNAFDKYSFVSVLASGRSYDIKEKKELYLKVFKKMSV
jgi:hypothetical protein